jgi:copper(I)-binding protein
VNITHPIISHSRRCFGALVLVAGLGLGACGSDDSSSDDAGTSEASDSEVSIADPWSRQPAEGQSNAAVYGVVTNAGDEDITAIGATASVTDTVELHQGIMNDEGQMSMSEKEGGYTIEAGASFTFEPGGAHIMMLGIDAATYPEMVDVTLAFDNGSTLDFTAEVRAIGDDDEMEMEDDG